jgi:hypothetical protein
MAKATASQVKVKEAIQPSPEPFIQPEEASVEAPVWKTIFYALLPTMAVLMIIASFWYGLSGDEAYANGMGKAAMKFIGSFGADESIFNQPDSVNRDGVLTYYGNIFDIMALLLAKILPFEEYTCRHIFNAFVGFLGIMYSGLLVKDYWKYKPAVITMLLMFFFPFYMGHAMNNPKDVPMAAFYIMGVYYLCKMYRNYAHLKWHHIVMAIISIILAIDVRVAGLLLIVYMPIIAIVHWKYVQESIDNKGWLKTIVPSVIVAVGAYLGCSLFWPFAAKNPLGAPLEALSFLSDFKIQLGQMWEGEKTASAELPENYLIRAIFITSPWVFIVGLLAFAITLFTTWKQNRWRWMALLIVFVGLFPLFYIMYKDSNVLFVFPPLAIASGLGWWGLGKLSKAKWAPAAALCLFALLLLEPVVFTAKTFPQNVNYYNSTVGGTSGAYGQYEMDFYYNSMKPMVDKLTKEIYPTVKDSIVVGCNGAHLLNEYLGNRYPKIKVRYVRYYQKNENPWDYAIFHCSMVPPELYADGKWASFNGPIATTEVEGKPLCVLLKRPSTDDLAMFSFIEQKNYPEAYKAAQAYLQKDPSNVDMQMIAKKLSDALKAAMPAQQP